MNQLIAHLCTDDSLLAGAHKVKHVCPVCFENCTQEAGYTIGRCSKCRLTYIPGDGPNIVTQRRKFMGLRRRDIVHCTGLKPDTVRRYERVRCSKNYWKLTERIVRDFKENPVSVKRFHKYKYLLKGRKE